MAVVSLDFIWRQIEKDRDFCYQLALNRGNLLCKHGAVISLQLVDTGSFPRCRSLPRLPLCESVCRMQMIRDPDINTESNDSISKTGSIWYKVYRREFLNLLKHVFAYILTGIVGVEFGVTLWNSFVRGRWRLIHFNALHRWNRLGQSFKNKFGEHKSFLWSHKPKLGTYM